jgi:membrane protease YdiL (CAAX protease family)
LTFYLLPLLAQRQWTNHLRSESTRELTLLAAGKSPWQWHFHDADAIVAGRVFGAHEFTFDDEELRIVADKMPFEIGLPIDRSVDLQHFPIIHIAASTDVPASLRIVARATLDAPELTGSSTVLQGAETTLDLRTQALPGRAAMLRLQFELPQGKTLRLRAASLDLAPNAVPPLVLELPAGSVEQQLLALRKIHDETPAAVVVPTGSTQATRNALAPTTIETPATNGLKWITFGLLVAIMLLERLRPPQNARLRAAVEIVLALAVPLWLIVGEHFTGRIDRLQASLITATMIYAISLAWPHSWRWNGTPNAWGLALAVVALAFFVGFAFHRAESGWRPIGAGHVLRYFAWALVQQYLICAVCLERWRVVTSSAAIAVYLSALCFALLHAPNSSLMLATFAGGLCWGALYVRERALLPLAFSHAASAMLLITLLPPDILRSAEVSARFFQ